MRRLLSLVLLTTVLMPDASDAATFYLDPVLGSMSGDGSAGAPWSTLQELIDGNLIETQEWDAYPYDPGRTLVIKNAGAPVKAGDTLRLLSGYHGEVGISSSYNAADIVIEAEAGHTPTLGGLLLQATSGWIVRGLRISPEYLPSYDSGTILDVQTHSWSGPSHDIVIEYCEIFSVDDVSGWSAADWNNLSASAVSVSGDRVTIRGNRLRNVNFGISVSGDNALVERNLVDSFAGDGLRGLGDYGTFQYNTVKNCYDVNGNHDDGFQSWSLGTNGSVGEGEVVGIVIRGNTILNYEDPLQPFRGSLQGIGCFDGFFTDWIVENNVVITDHWHGITLLGARDSRIVNNTVVDLNQVSPGPPWISIDDHKTRGASSGCLIRNNLATDINPGAGVVQDSNITVAMSSLGDHFVDALSFDLHLLSTSTAIDAGDPGLAPSLDRDEVSRPQGIAIDIGAYEWLSGPSANAGPDRDICLHESVRIGGNPTATGGAGAPYSYAWTSVPADPSMSCTDCANPDVSPIVLTVYTVMTTDSLGHESAEAQTTVTVNVPDPPAVVGNTLLLFKAVSMVPPSSNDMVATSAPVIGSSVAHVVRRFDSPNVPPPGTSLGTADPGEPLRLMAEVSSPVSPAYYRTGGVNCAGIEGPL